MGDMLRSDPMTLCDMYIQPEAAFEILSALGEEGCVQFHDVSNFYFKNLVVHFVNSLLL